MSTHPYMRSYVEDPTLYGRLFDLLDLWIPELRGASERARALRMNWEEVTTPFAHIEDGKVLSHVGLLDMPMVLMREAQHVGGIHAVCTHPDHRRKGLYRAVMEDALRYADARYETIELTTLDPQFYGDFGFRIVPEHVSRVRVDAPGGRDGFRRMDLDTQEDVDLLDRLLAEREPVSDVLGVVGEQAVFKFNRGAGALWYAAALDLLAVMDLEGSVLEIIDLITPEMCPLARLVEEFASPFEEARIHFSPDRLDVAAEPEPAPPGHGVLMVRGPFPPEGQHVMIPPSVRH